MQTDAADLLLSTKASMAEDILQWAVKLAKYNKTVGRMDLTSSDIGLGVRILSLDGGGIKGIVECIVLERIEEATGKPISELFDLIVGTSTGAIIALGCARQKLSAKQMTQMYENLSAEIFKDKSLRRFLTKGHKFHHKHLQSKLIEYFGKPSNPPYTHCCVTACDASAEHVENREFLFQFYDAQIKDCSNIASVLCWHAARASSAAPSFLPAFILPLTTTTSNGETTTRNAVLIDGGILNNNPVEVAIHEAAALWPKRPVELLLSLSCGREAPRKPSGPGKLSLASSCLDEAGQPSGLVDALAVVDPEIFGLRHIRTTLNRINRLVAPVDPVHHRVDGAIMAGHREGVKKDAYVRVCPVVPGIATIDLSDASRIPLLSATASAWLNGPDGVATLSTVIEKLKRPRSIDSVERFQQSLKLWYQTNYAVVKMFDSDKLGWSMNDICVNLCERSNENASNVIDSTQFLDHLPFAPFHISARMQQLPVKNGPTPTPGTVILQMEPGVRYSEQAPLFSPASIPWDVSSLLFASNEPHKIHAEHSLASKEITLQPQRVQETLLFNVAHIRAPAGHGKTTLTRRLCHLWSTGQLGRPKLVIGVSLSRALAVLSSSSLLGQLEALHEKREIFSAEEVLILFATCAKAKIIYGDTKSDDACMQQAQAVLIALKTAFLKPAETVIIIDGMDEVTAEVRRKWLPFLYTSSSDTREGLNSAEYQPIANGNLRVYFDRSRYACECAVISHKLCLVLTSRHGGIDRDMHVDAMFDIKPLGENCQAKFIDQFCRLFVARSEVQRLTRERLCSSLHEIIRTHSVEDLSTCPMLLLMICVVEAYMLSGRTKPRSVSEMPLLELFDMFCEWQFAHYTTKSLMFLPAATWKNEPEMVELQRLAFCNYCLLDFTSNPIISFPTSSKPACVDFATAIGFLTSEGSSESYTTITFQHDQFFGYFAALYFAEELKKIPLSVPGTFILEGLKSSITGTSNPIAFLFLQFLFDSALDLSLPANVLRGAYETLRASGDETPLASGLTIAMILTVSRDLNESKIKKRSNPFLDGSSERFGNVRYERLSPACKSLVDFVVRQPWDMLYIERNLLNIVWPEDGLPPADEDYPFLFVRCESGKDAFDFLQAAANAKLKLANAYITVKNEHGLELESVLKKVLSVDYVAITILPAGARIPSAKVILAAGKEPQIRRIVPPSAEFSDTIETL